MRNVITGLDIEGLLGEKLPLYGPHEPIDMWITRQLRKDFDRWLEHIPEALPEMLTDEQRALMFLAFLAGYDQRGDEE